jgi:fatty-acyl-CoA synthase
MNQPGQTQYRPGWTLERRLGNHVIKPRWRISRTGFVGVPHSGVGAPERGSRSGSSVHFNRYLSFWTRRQPDKTVLVCEDRSLTWGELERQSGALATFLDESGIGEGDRLGILLENSLEWCVAFCAAIRLGAILVPLNHNFGRFELAQIENDAQCAAIVSRRSYVSKLRGCENGGGSDEIAVFLGGDHSAAATYETILTRGGAYADRIFSDQRPLAICYTSGTTGVPKGAVLTHRAVEVMAQGLSLNFAWRAGEERFLILAPLAFTGGVISMLAPQLLTGSAGYLEKQVEPSLVLERLVKRRISYFGGVPALWERIAAGPGFPTADLSSLRAATTGGAPVPRSLLDLFAAKGVAIRQSYGFTEACGGVSTPTEAAALARPDACGYAQPSLDIEIRKSNGQLVQPGEIGEIRVKGPQLMSGYWNNPEATAAAFDGDWYLSGDLGTLTDDGALLITDRKSNMLISGGVNVYPAEVERAIATISGVVEVAVLGLPSERWGQEVAAIVFAPTMTDAAELAASSRTLLGAYKAPKHVVLSQVPLPRTASGKVARTGLDHLFRELSSLGK